MRILRYRYIFASNKWCCYLDLSIKKYLEMRGHEVFIVAPVKPEGEEKILLVPGIPFPLEKQHKVVFANHIKIIEFALENKIEIIHSHDPMALGMRALKVQKDLKLPHVHTYHTL